MKDSCQSLKDKGKLKTFVLAVFVSVEGYIDLRKFYESQTLKIILFSLHGIQ
jgi:hypothetical protein